MKGRKTNTHYGKLPELMAAWHKEKGIKKASPRTFQKACNDNVCILAFWRIIFQQMPAHRLWQDSLLLVEVNRVMQGRKRGKSKSRSKTRSQVNYDEYSHTVSR